MYYATAHKGDKQSWHIVTNLLMDRGMALRLAKQINEKA
jgi:hypothetical protein